MKKSIIALAIAGALAPVMAQAQSSVTIYGTLNASFENVKATGAANGGVDMPQRNRVTSNSSALGFKGVEDLGGGLKGIFQIESSIALDAGGGGLGSRNSNLGLSGGFGTVFLGIWDTPYKASSYHVDPFYVTGIASSSNVFGTAGFGVQTGTFTTPIADAGAAATAAGNASFDRRQGNALQYESPSFAGFQAKVQYSANEAKSNSTAAPQLNPSIWSAALAYANGPINVAYAYEQHNDYFGLRAPGTTANAAILSGAAVTPSAAGAANPGSKDTGHKLSGSYSFGDTKVGLAFERLEYKSDATTANEVNGYKRDAWYLSLVQKIGSGAIRASIARANDGKCTLVGSSCAAPDLGAKIFGLGYSYDLSKRTAVYGLYTQVKNDTAGTYNFGGAGALSGGAVGSDPQGIAFGLRHTF